MESIIATFHIDWKIIIAQVINFGVVVVVLYFFALKFLIKLLNERAEKISKGINDAKSNAILLQKTKAEYETVLAKARTEANTIFQEGKKEAEHKKALMLEDTKKQVSSMIENGKKTLENEKIKMVAQAKGEIVSVAVKIAEKLLGERVNTPLNEQTIKELNNLL